ncbi:MAG: PepSY domain-containing protein [Nitrososphaeraceae archaeon]
MKIVLTTMLVTLLAIGLIGINYSSSNINITGNAYAQMESEDSPMMQNDTEMMGMDDDDEGMMMTAMSNQSEEMKMKLNGTIDVKSTIGEAFKSKVTVNIIDAITTAQSNVGANSFVKEAELTAAHGFLVYKIQIVDENMKKYKVIVDPGNGQVLMKKEITWYDDEHEKMKYGEEKEKYGKYGHDEQYDKEKMMMMKDKKY